MSRQISGPGNRSNRRSNRAAEKGPAAQGIFLLLILQKAPLSLSDASDEQFTTIAGGRSPSALARGVIVHSRPVGRKMAMHFPRNVPSAQFITRSIGAFHFLWLIRTTLDCA
jgi:hypothetical protein